MSPWADIVGWPVEGPPRWTLMTTQGVSVMTANPMFSIIREKPGPLVAVMARAPVQEAPMIEAMRGDLVLHLDEDPAFLRAASLPCVRQPRSRG